MIIDTPYEPTVPSRHTTGGKKATLRPADNPSKSFAETVGDEMPSADAVLPIEEGADEVLVGGSAQEETIKNTLQKEPTQATSSSEEKQNELDDQEEVEEDDDDEDGYQADELNAPVLEASYIYLSD